MKMMTMLKRNSKAGGAVDIISLNDKKDVCRNNMTCMEAPDDLICLGFHT